MLIQETIAKTPKFWTVPCCDTHIKWRQNIDTCVYMSKMQWNNAWSPIDCEGFVLPQHIRTPIGCECCDTDFAPHNHNLNEWSSEILCNYIWTNYIYFWYWYISCQQSKFWGYPHPKHFFFFPLGRLLLDHALTLPEAVTWKIARFCLT